jgi:CDP-diglyceride synthetase
LADFSDLKNRVFYAIVLAAAGLICLLTKPSTAVFIAILTVGFVFEIVDTTCKSTAPKAKAPRITTAFAIVGIAGFVCAFVIRIGHDGFCNLLLAALGVMATDIFAYVGGKQLKGTKVGQKKLAPRISPNKTVVGFWCGVVAGIVVLLAAWLVLNANNDTSLSFSGIMCAMLIPPIAVLADLLKSWSKRLLGVKDFGKTLGAHGGVADRFDAMTAGFIVFELIMLVTS